MEATRTCSIDECDRPRKTRGWCNTHYERWRLHGTTDDPVAPDPNCQIPTCDRTTKARGWCKYHWQRWSRHGDPLAGGPPRSRSTGECAVEGCERRDAALGWCKAHYYRWYQYRDLMVDVPLGMPLTRPDDWVPGYSAAHWRVRVANGPASNFRCADCGGPADHWSYDHADPDEQVETHGRNARLAYSLDIEHYDPRCVSCHRAFDLAHGQP